MLRFSPEFHFDHTPLETSGRGIGIVRDLFTRLHAARLPYCQWKSNEHLDVSLEGLTDLDLLVDRQRVADLQNVLATCGFKRFAAPPQRDYPGIEDYLGCDRRTGRLVHAHLHYTLTLGQTHLKGYRLPWERNVLAARQLDPERDVYTADPAMECLLLLLRAALKYRTRDWLRSVFGRRSEMGDMGREYAWLRQRVADSKLQEVAQDLLGHKITEPLRRILSSPFTRDEIRTFTAAVRPMLKQYRTYGRSEALLRVLLRELRWTLDQFNRRYIHQPRPLHRYSPRGGAVIVLLGPDGSGKSTLARTLVGWLAAKLDVLPLYLGSGDGPGALYRLPLRLARSWMDSRLHKTQEQRGKLNRAIRSPGRAFEFLRAVGRVPWALTLSFEKRAKLRRMIRARNRGMIVICDRYPQNQVPGFNDGPLLAHWSQHSWGLCRALARWEAKPYAEAALDPPDLVMKLVLPAEIALTRRPEMTIEEVSRRLKVVQALEFPAVTRVVEVNAEDSAEQVALMAKQLVWDEI